MKNFIAKMITVVSVTSAIFTIIAFFQYKRPKLEIEVISEVNVLELSRDVSGLNVIYSNIDLIKENKEIKIIEMKFQNSGKDDIKIDFFDPNMPLQIKLSNGYFVSQPQIYNGTSDYLKSIKIISDANLFSLCPFMLEQNEFFIVKFLVLSDRDCKLNYEVSGKILRQNSLNIVENIKTEEKNFWKKAFQGNFLIQIVRTIGYLLLYTVVIGGTMGILYLLENFIIMINRKKDIKRFRESRNNKTSEIMESIFRYFLKGNIERLKIYLEILNSDKWEDFITGSVDLTSILRKEYIHDFSNEVRNELLSYSFILKNESVYIKNIELFEFLSDFLSYVKENDLSEYEKIH